MMMNSAMRSYQEKRNYIRMKVDAPVDITVSTDGNTYSGICRDLSGGGMMIELSDILPVGTDVDVSISSGHGHNPILRATASVTRGIAQPDADESQCTLGLQILEVLN